MSLRVLESRETVRASEATVHTVDHGVRILYDTRQICLYLTADSTNSMGWGCDETMRDDTFRRSAPNFHTTDESECDNDDVIKLNYRVLGRLLPLDARVEHAEQDVQTRPRLTLVDRLAPL